MSKHTSASSLQSLLDTAGPKFAQCQDVTLQLPKSLLLVDVSRWHCKFHREYPQLVALNPQQNSWNPKARQRRQRLYSFDASPRQFCWTWENLPQFTVMHFMASCSRPTWTKLQMSTQRRQRPSTATALGRQQPVLSHQLYTKVRQEGGPVLREKSVAPWHRQDGIAALGNIGYISPQTAIFKGTYRNNII